MADQSQTGGQREEERTGETKAHYVAKQQQAALDLQDRIGPDIQFEPGHDEDAGDDDEELDFDLVADMTPGLGDDGHRKLGGSLADRSFELAWSGPLPLLRQLPRSFSPVVRFAIDDAYQVSFLPIRRMRFAECGQEVIALAVAAYLRGSGVVLRDAASWLKIPRIQRKELFRHLPESLRIFVGSPGEKSAQEWLRQQAEGSQQPAIWALGILLPSGDVITPNTLTTGAAKSGENVRMKTTLAAVLRQRADLISLSSGKSTRPDSFADTQTWPTKEWRSFERSYLPKNEDMGQRLPQFCEEPESSSLKSHQIAPGMSTAIAGIENGRLYSAWIDDYFKDDPKACARLPRPQADGLFAAGGGRALLPYLRVYWTPDDTTDLPPWRPERWEKIYRAPKKSAAKSKAPKSKAPQVKGYECFMHAGDVLECITFLSGERADLKKVADSIIGALGTSRAEAGGGWLVPVDSGLAAQSQTLDRRVETIRLYSTKAGAGRREHRWIRSWRYLPEELREAVDGLDLVHTPESGRAGLTRYLCADWKIQEGHLCGDTTECWGPVTSTIPHATSNAPRRLMLGASLAMRSVELKAGGRSTSLKAAFSMHDGWTHEDAIVVSRSAVDKLTRLEPLKLWFDIPTVCSQWGLLIRAGDRVQRGQCLGRAWIDTYALGVSFFKCEEQAQAFPDASNAGWVEVALPRALAAFGGTVAKIEIDDTPTDRRRARIAVSILVDGLNVGDKLATWHGVKGVVSRILDDDDDDIAGAEVLLSQIGVIGRAAMGQFREMAPDDREDLPRAGEIAVLRQPQDSVLSARACGPKGDLVSGERGQRYGEMEMWALMAHGASQIARELLGRERTTAVWMNHEGTHSDDDCQTLATRAINKFLAFADRTIVDGCMIGTSQCLNEAAELPIESALDTLHDELWFHKAGGLAWLGVVVDGSLTKVPVLPPWLRPDAPGSVNPLTIVYERLIAAVTTKDGPTCKRLLISPLSEESSAQSIYALALGDRVGAGAFLKREVLGRRLTRSARAVIVPRPDLRIDQIAIPAWIWGRLFANLDAAPPLVLVNRNPTLHRYGLIALRPIREERPELANVFGLPLGVLKALNADFDGDQACVVALTTKEAQEEALRLLPGASEMRLDPFRNLPAFPLSKELSCPEAELELARDASKNQEQWCEAHKGLLEERKKEIKGNDCGWTDEVVVQALTKEGGKTKWSSSELWLGKVSQEEWQSQAKLDMRVVTGGVRQKGKHGGLLRTQLYRRPFQDPTLFAASVAALQAITERWTQMALDVKSKNEGDDNEFKPHAYFKNPAAELHQIEALDDKRPLDGDRVAKELGVTVKEPGALLSWMASPRAKKLLKSELPEPAKASTVSQLEDPRIGWFLR